MKMITNAMYVVFLCCLIFDNKGLGFTFEQALNGIISESSEDVQQQEIIKRESLPDIWNTKSAYGKDQYHVYFAGEKIQGAYANSFETLDYGYAKDKYAVYYMGKKIEGAYVGSFQLLNGGYAKDKYAVYYMGKKIPVSSVSTFVSNQ